MPDGTDVRMTLNYILDSSKEKYGEFRAIGMAMGDSITYSEFHERVLALAYQLQEKEGISRGDHIAILAENSDKWGAAYFAVVRLGAIVVPILPDLPESDVHHILNEMKVKTLFTTQRQLEKIYEYNGEINGPIITLDDFHTDMGVVEVTPFTSYLEESLAVFQTLKEKDELSFPDVQADDVASILYTSGTSGYSKAVMLTHKNFTSNAYSASGLMEIHPGAVFLSILPMAHTYEFTCGFILPVLMGCRIAYAGKVPTPAILQKLCAHEKPFAIFAVPLVLEKIYKKRVLPKIEQSKPLTMLTKVGLGRKIIYRQIGKKLLDFFGGKLKLMGIGGASLNPEVEKFLCEAKFPYLIGYGLTEAAPLLAGGPAGDKTIAVGSTGKVLPGVQIKIEDPDEKTGIGEILACGPNIMGGYLDDEEATAAVINEAGWLSTGDLGRMDEKGNLFICGRSKNVIVMSNGENVYPEAIEHKINAFNWVVESLVLENNGQLDAWIYPDYELIDEITKGQTRTQRREYIEQQFEDLRVKLNDQLSSASRITQVRERREPFIKTATHKIKRYLYVGDGMVG